MLRFSSWLAGRRTTRLLSFLGSIINPFISISSPSIKKLCFNTDYPEICISSIIPYLTPNTKTDPSSILQILIKACNKTTQTAIDSATKITKNPKTPSTIISRIEDCKESFGSAVDNLQSAMKAIPSKDFETVHIMLSSVKTNAETCNDGFVEGPGSNKNPLSYEGDLIHKVASNCLAIASLIN